MKNNQQRCFGTGKDFYEKYHDKEWGIPVHEDQHLFEMLCLEGAQAGLSWETILKRREGYRELFYQFDPKIVANMQDTELDTILKNPAIIRNKRKVYSVRDNAKIFLEIRKEFNSFDHYIWRYVDNKPIVNQWKEFKEVPARTEISDRISKDLKKRGMLFVGTKIIYAFMQAVGMVNDHLISCPCRRNSIKSSST